MENLITWLEKQIEGCDDLGDMKKEKWAFIQTLKKVRKEAINYSQCCTDLKDKEAPTFYEWLNLNNYAKSSEAKYLDENANCFTEKQLLEMYNDIVSTRTFTEDDVYNNIAEFVRLYSTYDYPDMTKEETLKDIKELWSELI
jgi:hypothetical protein